MIKRLIVNVSTMYILAIQEAPVIISEINPGFPWPETLYCGLNLAHDLKILPRAYPRS
jgi:hypothetical protein